MSVRKKVFSKTVDLLVVGLGPAGVSCLLQAKRAGISLLGVSDRPVGGLVRAARRLDNLPGHPGISGLRLARLMEKQLAERHLPTLFDLVISLRRKKNFWQARLRNAGIIQARAVVLACGTLPTPWELSCPGVHRDITTLPRGLAGRQVVVIGGGEAALDTALSCRDRGARVTVLVRGNQLRCYGALFEEARRAHLNILYRTAVRAAVRKGRLFQLETSRGGIACHHLLVCIGRQPRSELLPPVEANGIEELKGIGIFLAGDLIRGRERYAVSAMGDGQRAAIEAENFLRR